MLIESDDNVNVNMTIVVYFFLCDAGRIRILFAHLQPDLKLKRHRSIFWASTHIVTLYSDVCADYIYLFRCVRIKI